MRDFLILLPEAILLVTALVLFLGETTYFGEKTRPTLWIAFFGLGAAAAQTVLGYRLGVTTGFERTIISDGLGLFIRLTSFCFAGGTLIAASRAGEFIKNRTTAEVSALVLILTAAVSLLAGTTHLGTTWIVLSLVYAVGAVLIGVGRGSPFSAEGAIKFLPFAGLSLLFFLLAGVLLFARTGTLHLFELQKLSAFTLLSVRQQGVVFCLFFFSLAIPVGLFPFHLWAVDAFHGTPTTLSGFVHLCFRLAATAVLMRIMVGIFAQSTGPGVWTLPDESQFAWPGVLAAAFATSALWLSFLAIRQQRLRRLLAILSLVQSAQIWAGFLALDEIGFTAALFGTVVLGFALLGAFIVAAWFADHRKSDRYSDLAGILWASPREALVLGVFLLFLAGAPPFPGFIAQFALVSSALRAGRVVVAGALIGSWVLSGVAVSRALFAFWGPYRSVLQNSGENVPQESRTLLLALSLPVGLFIFGAQLLFQFASQSLELILW